MLYVQMLLSDSLFGTAITWLTSSANELFRGGICSIAAIMLVKGVMSH